MKTKRHYIMIRNVSTEQRLNFRQVCKKQGISMQQAFTFFVKAIISKKISFQMEIRPEYTQHQDKTIVEVSGEEKTE